jgi:hypothetical protein
MKLSFPPENFFICQVCLFFVNMILKLPAISILFLLNGVSFTCTSQTQHSGWSALFNTLKTGKKTSIHAESQFRSTGGLEHLQSAFVRAGLNYHIKKNMTATAGYGVFHNRRVISDKVNHAKEHRIWQQFTVNHSVNKLQVTHRFRLEQRFIEQVILKENELERDGYTYANRFRYFIRNILPFTKDAVFTNGGFAAFQNEIFAHFGDVSVVNGKHFDQNRLYLAAGYRVNKQWDLEMGYMNQYISGIDNAFTNNHILQIASYIRL